MILTLHGLTLTADPGRVTLDAPTVTLTSQADGELLLRAVVEALHTAGWLDTNGGGDAE